MVSSSLLSTEMTSGLGSELYCSKRLAFGPMWCVDVSGNMLLLLLLLLLLSIEAMLLVAEASAATFDDTDDDDDDEFKLLPTLNNLLLLWSDEAASWWLCTDADDCIRLEPLVTCWSRSKPPPTTIGETEEHITLVDVGVLTAICCCWCCCCARQNCSKGVIWSGDRSTLDGAEIMLLLLPLVLFLANGSVDDDRMRLLLSRREGRAMESWSQKPLRLLRASWLALGDWLLWFMTWTSTWSRPDSSHPANF